MNEADLHLLHSLYPPCRAVMRADSAAAALPVMAAGAGSVLFDEGSACQGFPLLLEGEITVVKADPSGRSIELYRVVPGEICMVSSSSLFNGQLYSAQGVCTAPARLVLIAPAQFMAWMLDAAFRTYVLGLFAARFNALTALVGAIAFTHLDQRLAGMLLGRGQQVQVTHQALADALGSAREMVTRLLHRFEAHGWITLSRGSIRIDDAAALRRFAQSGAATEL